MKSTLTTLAALFALATSMTGCATAPVAAVPVAAEQQATAVGHLEIYGASGYRVQTLSAYNLTDIDHVTLTLQKWNGSAFVDVTGATKTIARAALASAVTLSNLKMATSYKVVTRVYNDAAAAVEIDDTLDADNTVAFTTPSLAAGTGAQNSASADTVNDGTVSIAIPAKLKNKTFSGQAGAGSGVALTNGTIVNTTATETF